MKNAVYIWIGLAVIGLMWWKWTTQQATTDAGLSGSANIDTGKSVGVGQPSPLSTGTYIVQRGDTLTAIATRYNTTIDSLIAKNGFVKNTTYPNASALLMATSRNTSLIYVGQSLKV